MPPYPQAKNPCYFVSTEHAPKSQKEGYIKWNKNDVLGKHGYSFILKVTV